MNSDNSDACGQANSTSIRLMWTGKFLNSKGKSCGFKNIWICVDGTLNSLLYVRGRDLQGEGGGALGMGRWVSVVTPWA